MRMRVLIVGAGAVGQVYAYHFWKGGAQVGFLVKDKYAKDLRDKPCVLQELKPIFSTNPVIFKDYEVVDNLSHIKGGNWDVAVLTISSDALRQGPWLRDFVGSLSPSTTLLSLASGLEDRDLILKVGFPKDRLVDGFITFSSWQAPLPGEKWHPIKTLPSSQTNQPLGYLSTGPLPFCGPSNLLGPITSTLTRGGLYSIRLAPSIYNSLFAFPAVAAPLLVALEIEGWSFRSLAVSPIIPLTNRAMGECLAVTAERLQLPWVRYIGWFIWSIGLRIFLFLALWLMPFDFEAFTRYHFQKVGHQTKLFVDDYVATAGKLNLSSKNLQSLAKKNQRWH